VRQSTPAGRWNVRRGFLWGGAGLAASLWTLAEQLRCTGVVVFLFIDSLPSVGRGCPPRRFYEGGQYGGVVAHGCAYLQKTGRLAGPAPAAQSFHAKPENACSLALVDQRRRLIIHEVNSVKLEHMAARRRMTEGIMRATKAVVLWPELPSMGSYFAP